MEEFFYRELIKYLKLAEEKRRWNLFKDIHWGEANPGNWRENNCIVVTAKGEPFNRGIILDCWRQLGHLRCGPVLSDADPYVENSAYARFVRARSATPANRHFALQTRREAREKKDD